MNHRTAKLLLASVTAGGALSLLGFFAHQSTLAKSSANYTSIQVEAKTVDLRKLPELPRKRSALGKGTVVETRIPIGRGQLEQIKRDPLSTAAGRAASQANLNVKAVDAPPLIKGRTTSTYNCIGNAATGSAPSDSHGTVGRSNYVEVTNVDVGIYPKNSCTRQRFVSLKSFFGITDINTTAFDPRAIYDFVNDRYVVTAETRKTGSTDQFQYFAVSQTGNPLGAWTIYAIRLSSGTSFFCKKALTDFWDYPNLGYNKDKWFLTANNFPVSGSAYGVIMTIDKAPTLIGGTTTLRCYGTGASAVQFNTAPPMTRASQNNIAHFLGTGSGFGNRFLKYTLNTSTNLMTFNTPIPIPAWTAPPGAIQPTTTLRLETLDGRIQSNTVQIGNELVYAIHSLNVGGRAGLRLYRVNTTANTSSVLTTYAITNADAWGPSVALASGSPSTYSFYSFSYSSATLNPSAALVSRRTDGVGGNNLGFTYQVGVPMTNSCQNGTRCRWGDYSATSLDPLNLSSAFGVAQFMTGNSQFSWSTKIMGLRQP
jgi:hypothetical protein